MASPKDIALGVLTILFLATLGITIWLAVEYDNALKTSNPDDPGTTPQTSLGPQTTTAPNWSPQTTTTSGPSVDLFKRINCFPEQQGSNDWPWEITADDCLKRGCRFDLNTNGDKRVPICYMHPNDIGYRVTKASQSKDWYLELTLETLSTTAVFDPPISPIVFRAQIWNNQHLRITVIDSKKNRYEVPFTTTMVKDSAATPTTADFQLDYTENPFSFKVNRKSSGKVLFDTSIGGFVYSDRFIQIASTLPSSNLYGLGEHEHPSLRHDMTRYRVWPMFGRDQGGLGEGTNLYGTHPFYMVLEEDGNAHGVFVLNSNAQEVATFPAPGIIYRTIGGILDMHFSLGPNPNQVIQQHTEFVGRPFIPPYWSLGFHLSRYGYNNLTNMKDAVDRTRSAGIPLDVIYADIDHMDERKDFTIDPINFAGLPQYFRDELANEGLRSVIILDPAIPENLSSYEPWLAFKNKNAYITWENGSIMMGYVWPIEFVAFPDFFKKETQDTWEDLIVKHSKTIQFDGIWIDMNEPANFGTNEEKPFNWPPGWPPESLKCPDSYYDAPPYRTWNAIFYDERKQGGRQAKLSDKTLCMEALQNDGKFKHYDVHNLYGWSQTPPTLQALQTAYPGRRGFVLARSTFAGSGVYATHWLGDNLATWQHMHRSIIGMLEMSMFGIAHTGPDICGFMQSTTPELCLRWMQLGAFYPYSRNHNDNSSPDQDPVALGPDVAEESREYLHMRYYFLPFMYTLFYHANKDGSTVARPVFFEFPKDPAVWNIDRQFMLGSAMMIAPLLNPGESTVTAYVPTGTWVSFAKKPEFIDNCNGGVERKFDINGTVVLGRGGHVLVAQDTSVNDKSVTTQETRKNPMRIEAILDCNSRAFGDLFWDDGDSINTISAGKYLLAEYEARIDLLGNLVFASANSQLSSDATVTDGLKYGSLIVYSKRLSATVKNINVVCRETAVECPMLTCKFAADVQALQCDFEGNGMPVVNDFTVNVSF